MYAELGACMRSWVHVYKTALCAALPRDKSWVHVCGIGCMSIKRLGAWYAELGACTRKWKHVCGSGCMYAELGA